MLNFSLRSRPTTQLSQQAQICRLTENSKSKTRKTNMKTTCKLQITCEFTVQRPIQRILRRRQDSTKSSDYLWIHSPTAHSAYSNVTWKYHIIFNLPVNSQSKGPFSLFEYDLKLCHDLQLICEFTIQMPIELIRMWPEISHNLELTCELIVQNPDTFKIKMLLQASIKHAPSADIPEKSL